QDDLRIATPRWDTTLTAVACPAGMASSNDLLHAPFRMTGAICFGGELIRAMGFWCPPQLEHCFQDNFWEDVGRRCDNWRVCEHVIAEHLHPHANKAPMDDTYRHAYDRLESDRRAWESYQKSVDYIRLLARVRLAMERFMHVAA